MKVHAVKWYEVYTTLQKGIVLFFGLLFFISLILYVLPFFDFLIPFYFFSLLFFGGAAAIWFFQANKIFIPVIVLETIDNKPLWVLQWWLTHIAIEEFSRDYFIRYKKRLIPVVDLTQIEPSPFNIYDDVDLTVTANDIGRSLEHDSLKLLSTPKGINIAQGLKLGLLALMVGGGFFGIMALLGSANATP